MRSEMATKSSKSPKARESEAGGSGSQKGSDAELSPPTKKGRANTSSKR